MGGVSAYLERVYGSATSWSFKTVSVGASTTLVVGANPDRVMLLIENLGEYPLYIGTYPGFKNDEAIRIAETGGVMSLRVGEDGELTCSAIYGRSSVSSTLTVVAYEVTLR